MRRLLVGVGAVSLGVFGLIEIGCNGNVDICFGDECGPVADGGSDGSDGQIVPTGCDLTKDPKDSIACVDESIGLFVAATGSDSNAGTKGSPLKSIGAALAKISAQHSRVYVCEGTYGETVKVTSAAGIYGGFHCADWSYDGNQGKVGPAVPGYALDIENVNGSVTIEDLEFDAKDATAPGDSSIAVFVSTSTASIKRVKAVAGNGAAGADAIAASNYDVDADGGVLGGNKPVDDNGAASKDCAAVCKNHVGSVGGKGGDANTDGEDGGPAIPANPAGQDGKGGVHPGCSAGAHQGANAEAADAGVGGASISGHLLASGWTLTSASEGSAGGPGQGGGGGGGGITAGNIGGGGGGGCGGCGGAGGAAGTSGGSAFGLLSYQATITLNSCELTSGNGAAGKQGGVGQTGQLGGVYGDHAPAGSGCQGGPGGKGGDGAGGGGGAGGNSIAIGYVGTKPSVTGGTLTEGTAGAPGAGGTGAAGNDGLAGAAGTKADVQELP